MGSALGVDFLRREGDDQPRGYRSNAGSFDKNRKNLDAGAPTRFKRKYPLPSVGDRFGELTVLGTVREKRGACNFDMVRVQCSCGAEPYLVFDYNLRKGASTRCNTCAKKRAGHWRKSWHAYASVCPDDSHRARLLNRISAAITRCHSPTAKQYHAYGGRGIEVYAPWRQDKRAFLAHLVGLPGWDDPSNDMDRIDVDRGYEPGNIRFIPAGENRGGNKRTVRKLQERVHELEASLRLAERRIESLLHSADGSGAVVGSQLRV